MSKRLKDVTDLPAFLRERREELDLSQTQLAKRVGLDYPNFISHLEIGRSKFPLAQWRLYAQALEIDPGEFLLLLLGLRFPDMVGFLALKAKRPKA